MAPAVDATARRDKHLFRLAYGVLALAFWVSLAGFVVLLARPNHSKPLVWSGHIMGGVTSRACTAKPSFDEGVIAADSLRPPAACVRPGPPG